MYQLKSIFQTHNIPVRPTKKEDAIKIFRTHVQSQRETILSEYRTKQRPRDATAELGRGRRTVRRVQYDEYEYDEETKLSDTTNNRDVALNGRSGQRKRKTQLPKQIISYESSRPCANSVETPKNAFDSLAYANDNPPLLQKNHERHNSPVLLDNKTDTSAAPDTIRRLGLSDTDSLSESAQEGKIGTNDDVESTFDENENAYSNIQENASTPPDITQNKSERPEEEHTLTRSMMRDVLRTFLKIFLIVALIAIAFPLGYKQLEESYNIVLVDYFQKIIHSR
ncbi:hypothetical protein BX666DRAFT_815066 [Dichotomocladium elegans]|nr:hypothetical protein BX666DRAFT_815066 [Dichotomocladium elegans]